ncbi:MAG: glycosyltransferase family 39 protein [Bacteroidota bacterium]
MSATSLQQRFGYVLLVLIGMAIFLRWGSFAFSVINHDESTYIVIADELLRGERYLVESVDTKPIGIFWLYAAMVWLTKGSIIGLRLLTSVVIGLTAALWWASARKATGSNRVAWATGLIYIFLCSLFTYFGLSPNTELFFNAFTAAAILGFVQLAFSRANLSWLRNICTSAGVGLLLGMAVVIKPVAAAEALAIGLYFLWRGWQDRRLAVAVLQRCLPMTLAFTLPLLGVYLYYLQLGLVEELLFYNFELTKAYPVDKTLGERLLFLGEYLRFFPFLLLAGLAWYERKSADRSWQSFLLLQAFCVLLVILAPGKTFGHYMIQLHPVLAALAACWFLPTRNSLHRIRLWVNKHGIEWMMIIFLAIGLSHFARYQRKYDQPKALAGWLAPRLEAADELFMENYHQIVYHLLDKPVPTPYVHSSLLFYQHHVRAFSIDLQAEADRLIANPNLRYVVRRRRQPELYVNAITRAIDQHFAPVHEFDHELIIWERQ